jgi:hypothetical protein
VEFSDRITLRINDAGRVGPLFLFIALPKIKEERTEK